MTVIQTLYYTWMCDGAHCDAQTKTNDGDVPPTLWNRIHLSGPNGEIDGEDLGVLCPDCVGAIRALVEKQG